jgi:hypothetical protein
MHFFVPLRAIKNIRKIYIKYIIYKNYIILFILYYNKYNIYLYLFKYIFLIIKVNNIDVI